MLGRSLGSQRKHFVVSHFDAYQDGVLTAANNAAYEQHLAACRDCRDWVKRQNRLIERLRIEAPPPATLSTAAAARIQADVSGRMRRARFVDNMRSSAGTVAALAVLAVIVGLFIWWRSGTVDTAVLNEELFRAVNRGDPAEIERLLETGADANAVSSFGTLSDFPMLGSAITANNVEAVRLLIEHGADVNALDGDGNGLLPWAAARGYTEIVKLMLDAGADVNARMTTGGITAKENASALHFAAAGNHVETAKLLIDRGADVNLTEGTFGEAALHAAADENFAEMVALLLDSGADPDLQSSIGDTPLHASARSGSVEAAQVLIDHGAALDIVSEQGWTALDVSASDEFDQLLREAGASD
jgi:ankyrin repeat protein